MPKLVSQQSLHCLTVPPDKRKEYENMKIDVLFITHLRLPRDAGSAEVYAPLRLTLHDLPASIPVLRACAQGGPGAMSMPKTGQGLAFGIPPVLTPIHLAEYFRRQGLNLMELPCLESGEKELKEALAGGVKLIAFSTTWLPVPNGANALREAAEHIRALAPRVSIVAGGVGVRKGLRARQMFQEGKLTGAPLDRLADEYLLMDPARDAALDAIIIDEDGAASLAALARRINEGGSIGDLPNLAIPRAADYAFTKVEPEESDLDAEPIDWRRYCDRLGPFDAPVRTATGCPFQCEFCDFFGLHKPKLRSIESLIAELRSLPPWDRGPRRVFFADDNLAINRGRLFSFTRALIEARLNISWRTFIRADAVDAETAELMRASGCSECFVGVESGDPNILENMNKRLDPDRALKAIECLDANGINTQCTFVVGFPGECAASIERTAAFISAIPSGSRAKALQRYYLFRFNVLPLSPIASPERRAQFDLRGFGESWSHKTMNSQEALSAVRELFLKVKGPSHTYMELAPPEWPLAATRQVMELRDQVQKGRLQGTETPSLDALINAVAMAEKTSALKQNKP